MANPYLTSMVVVTDRHYFTARIPGGEETAMDPVNGTWVPAFLKQLAFVASLHPKMIVLREKDLSCEAYLTLSAQVEKICKEAGVPYAPHFYTEAISSTDGTPRIHLPLWKLEEIRKQEMETSSHILPAGCLAGTSVHSVEDALLAIQLGASWLFAGNVYETDCKKGLAGRGLEYLKNVSAAVSIPVYGIGGISFARMPEVMATGAAGGCMMSGFMKLTETDF